MGAATHIVRKNVRFSVTGKLCILADMHTNKGRLQWTLLVILAICCEVRADVLTVTPPTILETPPLAARRQNLAFPTIGVAGTNGILVWNENAGALPGTGTDSQSPNTNLVFARVDQTGALLDQTGHFLAARGRSIGPAALRGAGSTFFMVYARETNLVATRFDQNGHRLFEPVAISTNPAANHRVASNGKTLLVVYNTGIGRLEFALLADDGAIIAKGANTNSVYATSFDVATDGVDYLLVWQDRAAMRAARFDGATGAYQTVNVGVDSRDVAALGYGKGGYLLVAQSSGPSGQRVSVLDSNGFPIDGGEILPIPGFTVGAIYADGENWILFYHANGGLGSVRLTQLGPGLDVEMDPYRAVTGVPSSSAGANIVQPFGDGKFLVARNLGVSILSPSSNSQFSAPKQYAPQAGNQLVASPFGYLALWAQIDDIGHSILALRFAKDGTRIDAQPIRLPDSRGGPISGVFDGSAYVLAWLDSNLATRYGRISPVGPAALSSRAVAIPDGRMAFKLVANSAGRIILFDSEDISTGEAGLHVYALSSGGDIIGTNGLHGQTLVSDGSTIYSIGSETGEVYLWQIVPGDTPQEISRRTIGPGINAYGVSLRNAFALAWSDGNSQWNYAYMKNGVEQFRAPSLLPQSPKIAASDDHFLVSWVPTLNKNRVSFRSRNLVTGEHAAIVSDFGLNWTLSIASAGKDFFGLTDSTGPGIQYIGEFWITLASAPRFDLVTSNGFRTASLTLQPERLYRIERSTDLVNWQLLQRVTGQSRFEISPPPGDRVFLRANLVPE
jgi:hypothetical protein